MSDADEGDGNSKLSRASRTLPPFELAIRNPISNNKSARLSVSGDYSSASERSARSIIHEPRGNICLRGFAAGSEHRKEKRSTSGSNFPTADRRSPQASVVALSILACRECSAGEIQRSGKAEGTGRAACT